MLPQTINDSPEIGTPSFPITPWTKVPDSNDKIESNTIVVGHNTFEMTTGGSFQQNSTIMAAPNQSNMNSIVSSESK